MTGDDTLVRLAAALGIELAYTDVAGIARRAPDDTLEALCHAFGFAAGTAAERRAALGALQDEGRSVLVPPAVVARKAPGGTVAVDLALEAGTASVSLEWALALEDGALLEGRAVPADMPVVKVEQSGGRATEYRRWVLREAPAHGYHRLHLVARGRAALHAAADLVVAPAQCFVPPALGRGRRMWGIALQLYALRSEDNWGIGDFTDLRKFVSAAAGLGADVVGLNPLHALFPSRPEHCSPYSPSSRLFLNLLYLDVTAVSGYRETAEAQRVVESERFRSLHERAVRAPLIDYEAVAALKLPVLEHLFAWFRRRHLGTEPSVLGDAFRQFQREHGIALAQIGLFDALGERFAGEPDWRHWPEDMRKPDSAAVRHFAAERRDRIELFQYLQWECSRQLRAASIAAAEAGMGIGLYQDLAVGVDRTGAEAWANQDLLAAGAAIGAPPDAWNLNGQNWGLVPYDPRRLRRAKYLPLRETLRAVMGTGGAIRIDHVMGFRRLFWVPDGRHAADGAYVRYPFEDLLGIVALESWRQGCMVIGEDLGTVPTGFRERMQQERIYSYRLLYFDRSKDGEMRPPESYPEQSIASVGTHDLATLTGYWAGRDLAVRAGLGLYPSDEAASAAVDERRDDRRRIVRALRRRGLLPAGDADDVPMSSALALAVHRYLASCGSGLMVVQLEDILDVADQVNLPGTTTEQPNWRRKLDPAIEALSGDPRIRALAEALGELRPRRRGKARG